MTTAVPEQDELVDGTRERIFRLIVEQGPIQANTLAQILQITPAAVRRHLSNLEISDRIRTLEDPSSTKRGRGRPAKRFVAKPAAENEESAYADAALDALELLREHLGHEGIIAFAESRSDEIRDRYAAEIEKVGPDLQQRATRLAELLSQDGYAATARPLKGGVAVQMCQGNCPVHEIAAQYPELCEAETRAFSDLLGVHVQRLATLAGGEHVCTTHIPVKILTRKESR